MDKALLLMKEVSNVCFMDKDGKEYVDFHWIKTKRPDIIHLFKKWMRK
jgi:hypothetical protein